MYSIADKIAQFELRKSSEGGNLNTDETVKMSNIKTQRSRVPTLSYGQKYLDLDDIIEESSIDEDCDNHDSDGYLATSNDDTSSPDTSFRISGRSSCSSAQSDLSIGLNNSVDSSPRSNIIVKNNVTEKLSQKSLDSGFSDFSDNSKEQNIEQNNNTSLSVQNNNNQDRALKSSVVHETHANQDSSKHHHISKVYFYSVSDILQNSSTEFEDHLTLLKEESSAGDLNNDDLPTPRIDSSFCENDYFDRVESPFVPISSPALEESPFQRIPRVHTGTSSLRRKQKQEVEQEGKPTFPFVSHSESPSQSPVRKCPTPSQSPFPITNGSLYSDLSLNRRNKEQSNRKVNTSMYSSSQQYETFNSPSPLSSMCTTYSQDNYGFNLSHTRYTILLININVIAVTKINCVLQTFILSYINKSNCHLFQFKRFANIWSSRVLAVRVEKCQ